MGSVVEPGGHGRLVRRILPLPKGDRLEPFESLDETMTHSGSGPEVVGPDAASATYEVESGDVRRCLRLVVAGASDESAGGAPHEVSPEDCPTEDVAGVHVRRIVGEGGAAVDLGRPVLFVEANLRPAAIFTRTLPDRWNGLLYVESGEGAFDGWIAARPGTAIVVEGGGVIGIRSTGPLRCFLVAGRAEMRESWEFPSVTPGAPVFDAAGGSGSLGEFTARSPGRIWPERRCGLPSGLAAVPVNPTR
ncbi:MAG: hypothetical protein ACT4PT_10080 [Methanobacteriota archaeon]